MPCPVNSVGNLPLGYVDFNKADEVEAVLANTKQILNQFLCKSQLKQSNSLHFKPFEPLKNYYLVLERIEHLISIRDYEAARKLSEHLRRLALEGLHYFQTYDWFQLMTVITLGYIGWMIYVLLHVLQSYTSLPEKLVEEKQMVHLRKSTGKVYFIACLFSCLVCSLLLLEHSPPLYHAYAAMTIFLWTQIFSEYEFLLFLWRDLQRRESYYFIKLIATCIVSILILEMLVKSFTDRKLYTWCFLAVGVAAFIYLIRSIPWKSRVPIIVLLSCWFLSIFTLMPAEIPENTWLVVTSGVVIMIIGGVARHLDLHSEDDKYCLSLRTNGTSRPKFPMLFHLQITLIGLSSVMVVLSTSRRTEKHELLAVHQLINWSIAVCSMVLPLFSATGVLSRLNSIFLGFAPAFLLLSIGYEALFYCALALVLMAWMLFENAYLYLSKAGLLSTSVKDMQNIILKNDERCLQLSDVRIALTFMVFFNVAFFGTGNFASIASFEISSVYRFITIFSPFVMAALLIFKLLIPFMLVTCTFSSLTKVIRVPLLGCYFLVILCSDVMTIHFFFLVRNTGSWMEIGNSISHFGIMSAQVVFVLMLFALTNVYTRDIQTSSAQHWSRKAM